MMSDTEPETLDGRKSQAVRKKRLGIEGALWASVAEVVTHAKPDEVDREIRAQLDRAVRMGFHPTHLDSHMGTLFATPAFLERYVQLGIESQDPCHDAGRTCHLYSSRSQKRFHCAAQKRRQIQAWNGPPGRSSVGSGARIRRKTLARWSARPG
jgi:hypothetical protein